MAPLPKNVFDVLLQAALDAPDKGLSIYPRGQTKAPHRITYLQLLHEAVALSRMVRGIPGIGSETIVLLHLDDHQDNILWLWATVAAGLVPAMSTPFTNDLEQRRKHLAHLKEMLQDPVVITRRRLVPEFTVAEGSMQIVTVEDLRKHGEDMDDVPGNGLVHSPSATCTSKTGDDLFALMLTSGSTGHAKAVRLCHGQIVTALFGKSRYHGTTSRDVFLNWIGMDHVANLTEVHLHAMIVGADQIHVHALDLLAQPMMFVHLIDRHRASYTFAPNFFLASVRKALEAFAVSRSDSDPSPNLSSLRALISGGEANSTALASVLSELFCRFGAPSHFLRPGFGMTETCAGSIYGTRCPSFDVMHGREFTSLGRCIPCMSMRVRRQGSGPLAANEVGVLEVKGGNVFGGYFNNYEATASSFSPDGWFITGDLAFIDDGGNLHLVGREKETIIINGVKYFPHEIEGAIEDASIPGVTPSFTAVFPHRPENADSETLCVVYLPSYEVDDVESRLHARNAVRDVVMKHCMSRPYKIIPLERVFLPKTALGKLSRSKLRKAFESGVYGKAIELDEKLIARAQGSPEVVQPSTENELVLQDIFSDVFGVPSAEIGIHTNVYNLGCSSVELFRLKWAVQSQPQFPNAIPVTTMISNPTIASLLSAIDTTGGSISPTEYNPVVVLRSGGRKAPLWLVHPGVGEVLVFLNLANQITDRPIYALRAQGFDGEPLFGSLDEMVRTYLQAVRRTQPHGPYAIAGYSYGGTVAFEMAKVLLQRDGPDAVPFLAVFDQPPHIKQRMRHGRDWVDVLLTLVRFFNLLPDADGEASFRAAAMPDLNAESASSVEDRERLVELLLQHMAVERLEEYGLDKKRLARWTSLALNSHVIARDYEPSGRVPVLEVFYGDPIADVAPSKAEWLEKKLSRWADFVDDARFHEVHGHHYTLLSPENIDSFARIFVSRLAGRGL
ncbi:hypothetical protein QBC32DRAFT_316780 [Pseudoneurospora amorphoporcata]|uniref:Carrier domain-containing protein n=1 Tax=Pseudoneurospora amorphoporcata TaxID=241081 RepID=A0AAN6NPP7_9PEZI|nr:hypothetical protein QBC32DRAFT_316780 [Pseudoneurospora amorphoporcata]